MHTGLQVKCPLFLSYFGETLIWTDFRGKKSTQITNLMKTRPVGAADTRTHITKLIVAFRNFANAPKKTDKTYSPFMHASRK